MNSRAFRRKTGYSPSQLMTMIHQTKKELRNELKNMDADIVIKKSDLFALIKETESELEANQKIAEGSEPALKVNIGTKK